MRARLPSPSQRWPHSRQRPLLTPPKVTAAETPPPAARAASSVLGLMRMASTVLAIPIDALREVAACPAGLQALATTAGDVAGALHLRQQQVPVLDLGPRLGLPAQQAGKDKVVVILTWQQQRIGLLMDEVCGMTTVHAGQLQPVHETGSAERGSLCTALLSLPAGGCANLLDPAAIAGLPGLPWVPDRRSGLASPADAGQASEGRVSLLLFEAAPLPLALDATRVHTTVPRAEIRSNALTSELCAGVIDYQGRQVPVLDTLRALGLGQQPQATHASCLLLADDGGGLIALRLDRVLDIEAVPRQAIAPMPAMGVLDAGLFEGVYQCPQRGQHLVINPTGLMGHAWIRGLAQTAKPGRAYTSAARGDPAQPRASTQEDSYLIFNAGRPYACRLRAVAEIIRYPAGMVPLDGRGELLGLHMHKGRAVPLLCLSRLLGHPAPTDIDAVRVLLVERDGQMLGLAVQAIDAIESAMWHHRPHDKGDRTAGQLGELIEVGEAGSPGRRTVPVLDMARWLDVLTHPDAALGLHQRLAHSPVACGMNHAGCEVV